MAQNQLKNNNNSNKTSSSNKLRKLELANEIRRMVVAGESPKEIQLKLNLAPRSYWRHLNSIFQKDREVLRKVNVQEVLNQGAILRDRYLDIMQTLDEISKDRTIDAEDRIAASSARAEVGRSIAKIYTEAPAFVAMYYAGGGNRKDSENEALLEALEFSRKRSREEQQYKYNGYERNVVAKQISEQEQIDPEQEEEPMNGDARDEQQEEERPRDHEGW